MTDLPTNIQFPLLDAEKKAIGHWSTELKDHLDLAESAFNLLGRILGAAPPLPLPNVTKARKVSASLLVRLSNDLRGTALVSVRGYAVQAVTLVASMYEVTFTTAAIGNDEELAQRWIDHDDPTQLFLPITELTTRGIAALGLDPSKLADTHYQTYQQLCMAKHANPLFQMQHGHQLENDVITTQNGPDLSEQATRASWFALENAAGLASLAAGSFLTHHVPPAARLSLPSEVNTLGKKSVELRKRAIARWGTDDPFPGKWRRVKARAPKKP